MKRQEPINEQVLGPIIASERLYRCRDLTVR
jgi:hypothetical protein